MQQGAEGGRIRRLLGDRRGVVADPDFVEPERRPAVGEPAGGQDVAGGEHLAQRRRRRRADIGRAQQAGGEGGGAAQRGQQVRLGLVELVDHRRDGGTPGWRILSRSPAPLWYIAPQHRKSRGKGTPWQRPPDRIPRCSSAARTTPPGRCAGSCSRGCPACRSASRWWRRTTRRRGRSCCCSPPRSWCPAWCTRVCGCGTQWRLPNICTRSGRKPGCIRSTGRRARAAGRSRARCIRGFPPCVRPCR